MRDRRVTLYLLAPVCVLAIVYLGLALIAARSQPWGRVLGYDFAVYVSAADVVHDNGDPYNIRTLWAVERRLQGLGRHAPPVTLARVAEPPVLFWAMQPLTTLPFKRAILAGELLSLVSAVAGLLVLLASLNWGRKAPALLAGVLLPPTLAYIFEGNVGIAIFASLVIGLRIARRHPVGAGLALSLATFKPQVALPLAGLVILFHTASRRKAIAGFITGVVAILCGSAVVMGSQSLGWWLRGFQSFGGTIGHQPQIASLSALYVGRVPVHVGLLLTGSLLLVASVVTAITLWSLRHAGSLTVRSVAWLWILWFLVAPYDHFNDYLFLAPVLLSFLGTYGRADRVRAISLLYTASFVWLSQGAYLGQAVLCGILVSLVSEYSIARFRQIKKRLANQL